MSPKTISFVKMQGLGNDFVVLDGVRQSIRLTPALISQMADRHFGVGFDQLLLIEPAVENTSADFSYRIFNADATEVSQCGNGARCVGRFLREVGLIPPDQTRVLLRTKERVLEIYLREENQVAVNMGIPLFEPEEIPFQASDRRVRYPVVVDDQTVEIGAVSMGNPHAVVQVADIKQAPVSLLGPKLERHACFPEGVNVGFMECISRDKIKLRVYERGAGETLACGSGACAAMVIGCIQGLLNTEVSVDLLGGTLKISWLGENHPVWMVGPAKTVFKGQYFV
jgi:diaminopimelate epimerase